MVAAAPSKSRPDAVVANTHYIFFTPIGIGIASYRRSASLTTAWSDSSVKSALALLALMALPVFAAEPTVYGRYEYIKLPELDQTFKAKMDTGALTASLSAKDIETFKKDGDDWVRFRLATKDASDKVYEHKLARISKIKSRADEEDGDESAEIVKRPVIAVRMCLDGTSRIIEVNLTDRSSFNYPLLIGAKALREFDAAVNPARRFTAGKPQC